MTTSSAELSCRYLSSLWAAPTTFAAIAPDGTLLAGDAALAARAHAVLDGAPQAALVIGDGALIAVRECAGGPALAADARGAPLPGLLEADMRRMTSARP